MGVRGYTGTRVHGYTGTRVHWHTGTRVHGYTGTLVHGYTGTLVHGYTCTRVLSDLCFTFADCFLAIVLYLPSFSLNHAILSKRSVFVFSIPFRKASFYVFELR